MKLMDFFLTARIFLERRIRRLFGQRYMKLGRCRRCGGCCRDMRLIFADRIISTESEFDALIKEDQRYCRFKLLMKEDGTVAFTCDRINGENRCSDYENRPLACRMYPDPEQIFKHGCDAIDGCGFTILPIASFDEVLSEEMRRSPREKED